MIGPETTAEIVGGERLAADTPPMTDLSFGLRGQRVPAEHAHELEQQIFAALEWFTGEPDAGIHSIHVAASGNGWIRPDEDGEDMLVMSRRTRLVLRVPLGRVDAACALQGASLSLGGQRIEVGRARVRELAPSRTLFARHVICERPDDEDGFLGRATRTLRHAGIRCGELVCGRASAIARPDGKVWTRSLLVSCGSPGESIRLQQRGLGRGRTLGCGLFIPHKAVGPSPGPMDE